jgi:hypothetical protein
MLERHICRDARAQQRGSVLQLHALRDVHHEAVLDHDLLAIAAVGRRAVVFAAVVGLDVPLEAELLLAPNAVLAFTARVDHAPDAYTVADREPLHLRADGGDYTGDLMAGNHWEDRPAPLIPCLMDIAVADAAVLDVDLDIVAA